MLKDKIGDCFLSLTVVAQQLLGLLQLLLSGTFILTIEAAALFRVILTGLFVGLSLFWILKRKLLLFLVSYIVIGVLFVWTMFVSNTSVKYIIDEGIKFTCLTCIPTFLAMVSIKDMEVFHKTFLFFSVLTSFFGILYALLMFMGIIIQDSYNMGFGYSLMMPVMYLIYRGKTQYLLLALVTSVCVILNGSRGPFIVLMLYVAWLFFQNFTVKKLIFLILILTLVGLIYINIDWIFSVLSDYSVRSRTLFKLIGGEISDTSGREDIYQLGINKILESPIVGYGLYGDRMFYESYVHNIILEILIDFGIPLGCVVLLFLAVQFIYKLYVLKGKDLNFYVLVALSILQLMVSGSYLISFIFFFFLGLTVRLSKRTKIYWNK